MDTKLCLQEAEIFIATAGAHEDLCLLQLDGVHLFSAVKGLTPFQPPVLFTVPVAAYAKPLQSASHFKLRGCQFIRNKTESHIVNSFNFFIFFNNV